MQTKTLNISIVRRINIQVQQFVMFTLGVHLSEQTEQLYIFKYCLPGFRSIPKLEKNTLKSLSVVSRDSASCRSSQTFRAPRLRVSLP